LDGAHLWRESGAGLHYAPRGPTRVRAMTSAVYAVATGRKVARSGVVSACAFRDVTCALRRY
jgi:hypothetical protein